MVDALHMVPPFKIGVALCDAQRYQEAASAGFYFTKSGTGKGHLEHDKSRTQQVSRRTHRPSAKKDS
jgi:hypothetical protein